MAIRGRVVARSPHPSTVTEEVWLAVLSGFAAALWGFRVQLLLLGVLGAGFLELVIRAHLNVTGPLRSRLRS